MLARRRFALQGVRHLLLAGATLCALILSPTPAQCAVTVYLNYTSFSNRVQEAAELAGIPAFTGAEISTMTNVIHGQLDVIYDEFDVTFTETAPGGSFHTLAMGASTSLAGLLGNAFLIDWRNRISTQTVDIYPSNFFWAVTFSTNRATQVQHMATALAGTAGHELGHAFGLLHEDAYGDPRITNYANTHGFQNQHIMATGISGLSLSNRATSLREFGMLELAKLEYGLSLTTGGPPAAQAETGGAHGTAATAQALQFTNLPLSGTRASLLEGSVAAEDDYYSFAAGQGALLTVQVITTNTPTVLDPRVSLIDTNGTSVLFSNNDRRFSNNVWNTGFLVNLDPMILNFAMPYSGTFYLDVEANGGSGNYDLLVLIIPEPSTMMIAVFALGVMGSRRRRK